MAGAGAELVVRMDRVTRGRWQQNARRSHKRQVDAKQQCISREAAVHITVLIVHDAASWYYGTLARLRRPYHLPEELKSSDWTGETWPRDFPVIQS